MPDIEVNKVADREFVFCTLVSLISAKREQDAFRQVFGGPISQQGDKLLCLAAGVELESITDRLLFYAQSLNAGREDEERLVEGLRGTGYDLERLKKSVGQVCIPPVTNLDSAIDGLVRAIKAESPEEFYREVDLLRALKDQLVKSQGL